MMGIGPGLTGGTKATRDKVLKMMLEMVSPSRPNALLPKRLLMEAALVLMNSSSSFSVSKDGCPTMGVIIGCGRPSMILSEDDML